MTSELWTDQTQTSAKTSRPTDFPRTQTTQDVLSEAGHLRSRVRLLQDDTDDLSHQITSTTRSALDSELQKRTTAEARRGLQELLDELADAGFAWRDIARLVGVSVPALRKWRHGESATGSNRRAVASLVAFARLLAERHLVNDVSSWLEMPLHPDAPVTGLDLYEADRLDLLYDRASLHMTDEQALDIYEPGWRDTYRSEVEVFVADDGKTGLRVKNPDE